MEREMGSRFVALLVAVIGVITLAAAGIYLYRHHRATPGVEDKVAQGEKPADQPKPGESNPAETAPSKPTSVPSFDLVRIEPTGEGVIAGRAQPGWTVTLESGGTKIAETKADEEGGWSVVLDKPLPAGDHSLELRATSTDGTQALTGQQPVQVAVGKAGEEVAQKEPAAQEPAKEAAPAAPAEQTPAEVAAPEAPKPEQQAEAPQAVPGQPEPVVPDENAPPPERPKPPVKIGKLDYEDTGADSGKITMSGVGVPNVHVFFFYDQQPIGDLMIGSDGTWTFEVEKKLGEGEHTVRADTYDEKTGVVQGRASLRLGREPKAEGAETAAQEPPPPQPQSARAPEAAPAEPAVAQAGQPSGQPEPVYPEVQPQEAASPAPSAPVAAAEPQDLSSQPQPVHPEETAEPGPAAQPEATPAEPSAPVVAERPSEAKPSEPAKAPVVFKSVDYQDTGADSGKVALSGTGEPGARLFLYFDETPLGEVSVGNDGTWTFGAERKLGTGEHKFRADNIEEGTGIVVGSASIGIMRMEKPEPPKEEVAAAPTSPTPPAPKPAPEAATPAPEPESQVAAEEAKPAVTPEKRAERRPHRPRVYTVRRGDTLWEKIGRA